MFDVVIIGSGPAGLSAAVYAKRANKNVVIIEKMFYGLGQIALSSHVDNYIGLPGINGFDLGEKFRSHAEQLGVEFVTGNAVSFEKIEADEHPYFRIEMEDGSELFGKTVIYAAGAEHRKLNIPGELELIGKGVSYCATCDGAFFRGRDVAVIGGGNTALDDARYLSDIAHKVYVIHRRDSFRGAAGTVDALEKLDNVEFILNAVPKSILGNDMVEGIALEDGRELKVNGVFIAVGMKPATDSLVGFVELSEEGYVVADESCVTSVPGFFVAGDVRTKSLRQVVTAVSDGACSYASAEEYLG